MSTAFVDYAAQAEARQTIADNVLKNTRLLIEALKHNYVEYSIRGHQKFLNDPETQEYHQRKIDELQNGQCDIDYVIESGKKYHKVIFVNGGGGRSAHAFVDQKTGEVYKPSTWKAPAKGVRYDLRLIKDREWLLKNADWSGGYLYQK